jgi:hypothetical protein
MVMNLQVQVRRISWLAEWLSELALLHGVNYFLIYMGTECSAYSSPYHL